MRFSDEISDQATVLSKLLGTQLDYLSDVRDFYSQRVALEREYAKGLSSLAQKAQNKAGQVAELLVAGEAPSKHVREGADRQHTLAVAWQTIVTQADEEAYSRSNYAEAMALDAVEALKVMIKRMELLRTQHTDFASNLVKERDAAYNLKAKAKSKYDETCKAVESYRQKEMTAKNDKHAEKARSGKETAMVEMWNAKNSYLLSVEVSNRMLHKYFDKDLPTIHDDMQVLWTTIMARFKIIMKKQCNATTRQYEVLQRYNENGLKLVTAIDAEKDQALFVDYNKRSFFPPPDFTFEPCTIWHDNSNFSLEAEPKLYLQNKLAKDEADMDEIGPRVDSVRREVTKLEELRKAYVENPALGDLDSVTEQYFQAVQQAVSAETEQETLEAEIDLLHDTLGDEASSNGQAHDFKSSAFPVAKICYVCQGKIWGMGKVGLSCRECSTTLHKECEMKCPADCGDPILDKARASTRAAISSAPNVSGSGGYDSPSLSKRNSMAPSIRSQPSTNGSVPSSPSVRQSAKATYDYDAQSGSQLSITAGESLTVMAPDKGGWTKVSNSSGETGIVPSNRIQVKASAPPPPLTRRPTSSAASLSSSRSAGGGGSAAYGTVTAAYTYSAGSAQELTISKGDVLELTARGSDYAAGWTEVIKDGRKGIVPTSYVR